MSYRNNYSQNKHCEGYSLIQALLSLFFISILSFFSLRGLESWTTHEHLKQDLKNIHLGLELALAEANLGQTIFICPLKNNPDLSLNTSVYSCQASGSRQLLIIQDSNKNNKPDSEDLVLKKIKLNTQDALLTLTAFGEHDQFITLGPENIHQNINQNFSLKLSFKNNIKNNIKNKTKTGFTMSTLGDIQAVS